MDDAVIHAKRSVARRIAEVEQQNRLIGQIFLFQQQSQMQGRCSSSDTGARAEDRDHLTGRLGRQRGRLLQNALDCAQAVDGRLQLDEIARARAHGFEDQSAVGTMGEAHHPESRIHR